MARAADIVCLEDDRLFAPFRLVVAHQLDRELRARHIHKSNGDLRLLRLLNKTARLEKALVFPMRNMLVGHCPQNPLIIRKRFFDVVHKNAYM